ncbi:A-kinase anchor protein 8-like, partial [Zonotrichia leucophrys gambelii]|uniref:A-kinase anchor protein 8-like n=1 Tax=Zonotrichia leucophrys gambelii TaxID=257770 RepID=UPI003140C033
EGEDEEGRDSEKGALSNPEENSELSQPRPKLPRKSQERQKRRHRDRMVERIQFVCSLCKFRTFFEDEIRQHLESKFHQEHFRFVGARLPARTAQFLQEYVANKTRKTEERRRGIRDINAVIQQIHREQDLTQDLGLEHFVRRVEAAHCSACDLLLPMHWGSIQRHLRAPEHGHNRRAMLEQSKRASLAVARSILNNKLISSKLQSFLQGENPFTDDAEEKEEQEEGAGEENPTENPQNPEENPQNPENPTEKHQNPENSTKNPQNPEENPEKSTKNPQNPEENPENSTENPQNPEENSTENPEENLENSTENPQNFEDSEENLEELEENLENSEKNPENSEENSKENENSEEISAAKKQQKGPGTNPEGENSQNSQISQISQNSEEVPESSGRFQE